MKAMKKIALTLLCVVLSLLACFCFVACGEKGDGGKGDGGSGDGGTTPTPPTPPAPVIAVGDISGSFTYDGTEQKPTLSVTIDGVAMVAGTDYNLVYANNISAGTASVTVDFIGEYADKTDVTKNFTIGAKALTPAVTLGETEFTYDGTAKTPAVTVKDGETTLVKDTDYTVAYSANTNAGAASVTVTLKGNYAGSKTTNFTINKATVAKPEADDTPFVYNGQAQTYTLAPNAGYTITGNLTATNAGTEVITVSLNDNYEWTDETSEDATYDFVIAPFDVTANPLATLTVADIVEGEVPQAIVAIDGIPFSATDYSVTLGEYESVATSVEASVSFGTEGNIVGTLTDTYEVKSISTLITSYLDFNYELIDRIGGKPVSMVGSAPNQNYVTGNDGSRAISLTSGEKTIVKLENASLGTDDFTIFMDVKFDMADIASGTNEGNAVFEMGAHLAYNPAGKNNSCNGTNCSKAGCPAGLANDVVKISLCRDGNGSDVHKLRVQVGKDPNKSGEVTNITLTAEQLALFRTEGNEGKWVNIALSVNRKASIVDTTETAEVKVFLNGVCILTRNLTYAITDDNYYVLGNGDLYLGGQCDWTSGGGVSERDRLIDNFVLLSGALNETQVKDKLTAFVASQNAKSDWKVDDVTFDYTQVTANAYSSEVTIEGTATLTGATLKNANGIMLTPVDGQDGKYTLALDADGLALVKGGKDITVSLNGVDKTFNINYTALEAIYASKANIVICDFEIGVDGIEKTFKITADQAGSVPVSGVTFSGEFGSKIAETATAGEYKLMLSKEEAEAIADPVTVTATINDISTTFTVSLSSVLNETTTYASGTAIADVKRNIAIGTTSFTAGFNISIPASFTGTSDILRDFFATSSQRSGGTGFRLSFRLDKSKGYQVCMQPNSISPLALIWYTFGDGRANGTFDWVNKTASFVVEINRSSATSMTLDLYIDGRKLIPDNNAANSYTVSENFTPQSSTDTNIIFGYGGWSGDSSNAALKSGNGFTLSDIIVHRCVCAEAMTAELMARKA